MPILQDIDCSKLASYDGETMICSGYLNVSYFSPVQACHLASTGANFISQKLRGIPPGGILLLTLIGTFPLFSPWE